MLEAYHNKFQYPDNLQSVCCNYGIPDLCSLNILLALSPLHSSNGCSLFSRPPLSRDTDPRCCNQDALNAFLTSLMLCTLFRPNTSCEALHLITQLSFPIREQSQHCFLGVVSFSSPPPSHFHPLRWHLSFGKGYHSLGRQTDIQWKNENNTEENNLETDE